MPTFAPGTHVANHFIVRHLGSGRIADVYEVIAPGGARRALKLLKADAPLDSKLPARLAQEAEIVATIEHVNVVRFHGAGVDLAAGPDRGRVWLLLELVEGPDLRRLARDAGGALPAERAVSIIRQAAEGVAAAHRLGILHRSLEPENILVASGDLAKVADFCSAKLEGYGVKTTREQQLASSLYMAPEYMRRREAEPASDVYAMALILYEIVGGAHPLLPASATPIEICRRQLGYDPPPLATLGRGIPSDLSDLVQGALSKDPSRRCSMQGFADGLSLALSRLHAPRRAAARSVPLPNRGPALAATDLAMPAFTDRGTMPLISSSNPHDPRDPRAPASSPASRSTSQRSATPPPTAPSSAAPRSSPPRVASIDTSTRMERSAVLPPAPSNGARTLRSPSPHFATETTPAPIAAARCDAAPPAERSSTAVPVERQAPPPAQSGAERRARQSFAWTGALLLLGVLGLGSTLAVRGSMAPASAPYLEAPPPVIPPAVSSAVPPPQTSASAPPPRASASVPRLRKAPPPAKMPSQRR